MRIKLDIMSLGPINIMSWDPFQAGENFWLPFHCFRVSSVKVYGAVAPPHQLLAGVQSTAVVSENTTKVIATSASLTADYIQSPVTSSVTSPGTTTVTNGRSLPDVPFHPQSSLSHGSSYNGYGGIYPQATPLQQVALALRQSTSPITSTVSATQKTGNTIASTISEKEKRPPHKRKFQELPATAKGPSITNQVSVLTL